MRTVRELQSKFRELSTALGSNCSLAATTQHDGTPHVEVSPSAYHFVVTERGSENERRTTQSEDELLYWFATSLLTFPMALDFEVNHRVPNQDFRRIMWERELALLARLSEAWAARRREHIAEILSRNPFRDSIES